VKRKRARSCGPVTRKKTNCCAGTTRRRGHRSRPEGQGMHSTKAQLVTSFRGRMLLAAEAAAADEAATQRPVVCPDPPVKGAGRLGGLGVHPESTNFGCPGRAIACQTGCAVSEVDPADARTWMGAYPHPIAWGRRWRCGRPRGGLQAQD